MQLFRGVMRVNASDRSQAYVTLKGLTADIFVKVSGADKRLFMHEGLIKKNFSHAQLPTAVYELKHSC